MFNRPNDRLTLLVDIAMGDQPLSAAGELTDRESSRLEQLKMTVAELRAVMPQVPEATMRKAMAIMPERKPMRLLDFSMMLKPMHAARSGGNQHQFAFQDGEVSLRIMYSAIPDGWEVLGKVNQSGALSVLGNETVECDPSGTFRFEVSTLDHSRIQIIGLEETLVVPNAQEILDHDE
ncbi:MAG: hypothetical protein KDC26_02365 [Armatimonadetes bacterium]|nr:hypothetical protein [Armatimonadota bacterium]